MADEKCFIAFKIRDERLAKLSLFPADILVSISKRLPEMGGDRNFIRIGSGCLYANSKFQGKQFDLVAYYPHHQIGSNEPVWRCAVQCSNYVHWPWWKHLFLRPIPLNQLYSGESLQKFLSSVADILSSDTRFYDIKCLTIREWVNIK